MEEEDKGRKLSGKDFFFYPQPLKKRCVKRCIKMCIPLFAIWEWESERSWQSYVPYTLIFFFMFSLWMWLGMIHYFCPLVVSLAWRLQLKDIILCKKGLLRRCPSAIWQNLLLALRPTSDNNGERLRHANEKQQQRNTQVCIMAREIQNMVIMKDICASMHVT